MGQTMFSSEPNSDQTVTIERELLSLDVTLQNQLDRLRMVHPWFDYEREGATPGRAIFRVYHRRPPTSRRLWAALKTKTGLLSEGETPEPDWPKGQLREMGEVQLLFVTAGQTQMNWQTGARPWLDEVATRAYMAALIPILDEVATPLQTSMGKHTVPHLAETGRDREPLRPWLTQLTRDELAPMLSQGEGAIAQKPQNGNGSMVKAGGRPRLAVNIWAWKEVNVRGRPQREVYEEWLERRGEDAKILADPWDSFKKATSRKKGNNENSL